MNYFPHPPGCVYQIVIMCHTFWYSTCNKKNNTKFYILNKDKRMFYCYTHFTKSSMAYKEMWPLGGQVSLESSDVRHDHHQQHGA